MTHRMIALALAGAGLSLAMPATAQSDQSAPEKGREMFMKVDADKDGALSAAEWKAAGRRDRGFAMADADKDGKVTPDELRALAARFRR